MKGAAFRPQATLALFMPVTLSFVFFGCRSRTVKSGDEIVQVTIDLNKTAPIGYEICGEKGPKLSAADLELRLQMPEGFAIPPDQRNYGATSVEFKPGLHEIDLYKDLHSARVIHTNGELTLEKGVRTIRAKLPMAKLPKGRYILGISGDPFFVYCTVELQ